MIAPFIVVGLGNPGKQYARTRHNIGFRVVERVAERLGCSFHAEAHFLGRYAKGTVKVGQEKVAEVKGERERTVHLLLPQTYMNESGQAVRLIAHYYKALAPDILVVCDDIALPFGTLRVRMRGSPGGHNGLKSIEAHLKSPNYPRLKIGVGDERDGSLADHVLAPFTEAEQQRLPEFIDLAAKVVDDLLHNDIHKVMAAVNTKGTKIDETTKT